MHIYELRLLGHLIRFANDADEPSEPIWKTKLDEGMWTVGQADLSLELQEATDDVLRIARLLPPNKVAVRLVPTRVSEDEVVWDRRGRA